MQNSKFQLAAPSLQLNTNLCEMVLLLESFKRLQRVRVQRHVVRLQLSERLETRLWRAGAGPRQVRAVIGREVSQTPRHAHAVVEGASKQRQTVGDILRQQRQPLLGADVSQSVVVLRVPATRRGGRGRGCVCLCLSIEPHSLASNYHYSSTARAADKR